MSSFNPVIIIPSYNTGAQLLRTTVQEVLSLQIPVLVVVDGSTDRSDAVLEELEGSYPHLSVLLKAENSGKGDALLKAAEKAISEGYTHGLVMDSDGQHPVAMIRSMLDLSRKHPDALIAGQPVFGQDAPIARVIGRKLTSFWTSLETLWCGLGDSLFGMRVYPLKAFCNVFSQTSFARGFEFDPEIAVRMVWSGCPPLKIDVPVRYLSKDEGGVSHFHYLRDNVKLTFLHFRLLPELILFRMIPFLIKRRKWKNPSSPSSES